MRNSLVLFIYLLMSFEFTQTQNLVVVPGQTELTPVRGHYKTLGAIDPKPLTDHEAIDKLTFPYDEIFASKVLSDKPYYLKDVSVNDFILPNPPANSSPQTRAELNYLIGLQENRSSEDIRSSLYMSSVFLSPADMGKLIGYWFDSVKLPLTDSLFSNVAEDANYFLWSLKFKYKRVRPYMLDSKIHDLEESKASSYPSGHVSYAYIYAYIYALLAPEFTDYFIKDAYAMAHAREIIGVHYPSDSEASRIFARQLVNKFLKNQKFISDLQKVKNEWDTKEKSNLHVLNEIHSN
jgi:acid phosphatase (class A)